LLSQNETGSLIDTAAAPCLFTFSSFTLDGGRGVLQREGKEIALRPKSFEVLVFLLKNTGRLVSREELMQAVWPDVIVTDDSLTQCLTEIRKALGDDQRNIVRTIPKRGYLFDIPVEVPGPTAGDTAKMNSIRERLPSFWMIAAMTILSLAAGTIWWRAGPNPQQVAVKQDQSQTSEKPSIAVLPFVDLSENGDQEYLAYGISEEILNMLSQIPDLTVIARTSSFAFVNRNLDIETISRRLNVTHVLEGSVRKSGNRVRVTAQLIDGFSEAHLWSHSYDDRMDDVFAMQKNIASAVTEVLASNLTAVNDPADLLAETVDQSRNLDAWQLYLRGNYFYGRRAEGDVILAQRDYEQALKLDPDFAAAWVGLANVMYLYAFDENVTNIDGLTAAEARPRMRQAVERALEIDPHNPVAHLRMVRILWEEDHFEAALEQIKLAMKYGQNNAMVQAVLAGLAVRTVNMETAIKLQRQAVRLDPVSNLHISNLAYYLYLAGRIDESRAALNQALELNPEEFPGHVELALFIAILQGDIETAAIEMRKLPAGPVREQARSMLLYQAGNDLEAAEVLDRLIDRGDLNSLSSAALILGFRGEIDETFTMLTRLTDDLHNAPESTDPQWIFLELRYSPFMQTLRSDPRWREWSQGNWDKLQFPLTAEIAAAVQNFTVTGSTTKHGQN